MVVMTGKMYMYGLVALLASSSRLPIVASLQSKSTFTASHKFSSRDRIPLFAGASDEDASSTSGGILSMKSLQSQLASAFTALDESDQYDAVLTGLCAKILDQPGVSDSSSTKTLEDPIQLVQEMNTRRIKASARSLMSFIDVSCHWRVDFALFLD